MQNNPRQGDRIEVINIPNDYPYKDLYKTGVVSNTNDKKGTVSFFTNYCPYYDNNKFSVSGCGNSTLITDLVFTKTAPATFWKFKDNVQKSGNAEYYELDVQYFTIDFNLIQNGLPNDHWCGPMR